MSGATYIGQELEIFRHAENWKAYWSSCTKPFLAGDVLEVGAGLGANTLILRPHTDGRWVCLEPDPSLADELAEISRGFIAKEACDVIRGTIDDLPLEAAFDTILYIDVLEHIRDDKAELRAAASRLRAGGSLVVLAPAWNLLFSEFDRAVGHFRRYTKETLVLAGPASLRLRSLRYLDSAGLLLSAGNRLLLRQSVPTINQIKFWDRVIVPLSRRIDRLTGFTAGKSVLAVWASPSSRT